MTDQLFQHITVILSGILGVAILSVLVSKNANTSDVISSASRGFSGALSTALSPVATAGGIQMMDLSGFGF